MPALRLWYALTIVLHIHPHPEWHWVLELLGYAVAFFIYTRQRRRAGDVIGLPERWGVIAAATLGALAGSRILGSLQDAQHLHLAFFRVLFLNGGKTVVGGLLGGWLAVEGYKLLKGIGARTGDLFAIPLCIGIAIGRIGCFLAGTDDDAYGSPTSLPWGVDFGDGMRRHPTQVYEIVFVTLLAVLLCRLSARTHVAGSMFRVFVAAYLTWRLSVDFLKPGQWPGGMSPIQWACAGGLLFLFFTWRAHEHVQEESAAVNYG